MNGKLRTLSVVAAVAIPIVGATAQFLVALLHAHAPWYRALFASFSVLVFLGAASLLLIKRANDSRARVAAVLSAFVGVTMIVPDDPTLWDRISKGPPAALLWSEAFFYIATIGLIGTMLLHLVMVFPQPAPITKRLRPLLLYLITLAAAVAVPSVAYPESGFGIRDAAAFLAVIAQVSFIFAVPVVMWRQYRRSSFEEKRQIRWPMFGIAVAIVFGVIVPSVSMWKLTLGRGPGQNEIFIGFAALATPFVMIPLTFLMAIFKYRLLDIDVIVRKTITYTVVTFALVLLYAAGVTAASRVLASRGITNETMRLVTTAIVAALFVPLRDRVQRRIDARFYRRKYDDIESIRLLDEGIASATDLQSLLSEAAARLQQIFVCRAAAILVREPRSSTLTISAAIGLHDEAIQSTQLADDSSATRSICNLDLHPEQSPDEDAVRTMRARLLVPVRSHGELAAVIALGAKMSDEIYDARDERLAAALADHLAAAIENYRFRQLTAAEAEWRTIDRISRLVFVAIAQQSGEASIDRAVEDARTAIEAAGLPATDGRIETAIARLGDLGAIERSHDGKVRVTRRNWLNLPDVLRPLELVARDAGQRVGAYEILDRIGRGGMGEVYRATNVHDGSFAAVKILPPLDARAEARRRFEREGALVGALSHANIVRVLERGEHDGRLYIAMELIDGQTLSAALDGDDWNAGRAVHMALQIASALAELHSLGVVHRDVKSSNVMLTRSGRAVLLDFGLARSGDASSLTAEAHIVGSLPYMAPEQFAGTFSDARADVWSFGVVLFESLTGRRPWLSSSPTALISEIGGGVSDWSRLDCLAGLSPITTIIRESLQIDPALRIRDGAELLRRLTHAAQLTSSAGQRIIIPQRRLHADAPTLTAPAQLL